MAVPARREDGNEDGADVTVNHHDFVDDVDDDVPPHLRALADAAENGDVDALRAALDNHSGSVDDPVEDGDTLLHLSCLYGHLSCVQLLLERGANIEVKDEEGALPLHDACAGGYVEIVQCIMNHASGPDSLDRMINAIDSEGDTPLHHAARGEHLEVVLMLLEAGASASKRNIYGKIPAELADQDTRVREVLVEISPDSSFTDAPCSGTI